MHLVATVIDGYGKFWAWCETCTFSLGPYDDEPEADREALRHEELTRSGA